MGIPSNTPKLNKGAVAKGAKSKVATTAYENRTWVINAEGQRAHVEELSPPFIEGDIATWPAFVIHTEPNETGYLKATSADLVIGGQVIPLKARVNVVGWIANAAGKNDTERNVLRATVPMDVRIIFTDQLAGLALSFEDVISRGVTPYLGTLLVWSNKIRQTVNFLKPQISIVGASSPIPRRDALSKVFMSGGDKQGNEAAALISIERGVKTPMIQMALDASVLAEIKTHLKSAVHVNPTAGNVDISDILS